MKGYLGVLWSDEVRGINRIIQMRRYLGVPYILVILSSYKYLCRIYYAFKNKSRYSIDIKNYKDIKSTNGKIYLQKILKVRYLSKSYK